jgi:hypothetical protein
MKNLIVPLFLLFSICLFAQENEQVRMFSTLKVGFLAGINFSDQSGSSFVLEGKTNIISNLNLKLSLGYSVINKNDVFTVKTYQYIVSTNHSQYEAESYTVDKINYDVFPISLGLEYFISRNVFSPYALLEAGYNYSNIHPIRSGGNISIAAGYFDTFDQLPAAYKGEISTDNPYRIAVGAGTTYKVTSYINLDIRYVFQYNKSIANTHQILLGVNI